MVRMMRAEWFRIKNSTHFLSWALFVWLCLALFPMLEGIGAQESSLQTYIMGMGEMDIMCIPLFSGIWISVCIGMSYHNKTAYYEIMDGHSVLFMLFSKMILYTAVMAVGLGVVLGIFGAAIGFIKGMGDIDQLSVRLVLFFIVFVHFCLAAVLMSLLAQGLSGIGMIFLRVELLEGICFMMIPELLHVFWDVSENAGRRILDWFITSQLETIFMGKITKHLVFAVCVSTVVECGLWFAAAYARLRKR